MSFSSLFVYSPLTIKLQHCIINNPKFKIGDFVSLPDISFACCVILSEQHPSEKLHLFVFNPFRYLEAHLLFSPYGGIIVRDRDTVRLVLMNDQKRVLLLKIEDNEPVYSDQPESNIFWVTPGGGVEYGETFQQALVREAWEEVGLQLTETGFCVWTEDPVREFADEIVRFNTRYYFIHVPTHRVEQSNLTPLEEDVFRGYHWWSLEEMHSTNDILLPPGLPDLIAPLVSGDLPLEPIHILRP